MTNGEQQQHRGPAGWNEWFILTPHQPSAQYLSKPCISWLLPGSCWATLNACPAMPVGAVDPISQINAIHSLSDISLWMAGLLYITECTGGGKKKTHNNQWVEQTNTMSAHSWRAKRCLLPFGSPWKQPNTQPALSSAPTRHTAVHVWWQVGHFCLPRAANTPITQIEKWRRSHLSSTFTFDWRCQSQLGDMEIWTGQCVGGRR